MGRLHIFFTAAFSIRLVSSLPQPPSGWDLLDSSNSLAYDTSSLLSADPSDGSNMFSSESILPTGTSSTDWNSYDLGSLPLDSGTSPEIPLSGDDLLWDDSSYLSSPDQVASGCSGTISKRNEAGAACPAFMSEKTNPNPCGPDKEAMCCTPTWMFRSRWPGGGFNMDNCAELVTAEACVASGGSVQCCTWTANLLNSVRWGCTLLGSVPGNKQPDAPAPEIPQEPAIPPTPEIPVPEPVPGEPVPELQPIFPQGTGF